MGFGGLIHRSITGEVRKQDQINIEDYIDGKLVINPDGTCDVEGSVHVDGLHLKSLGVFYPKIRKVTKHFFCEDNELEDLMGAPEEVMEDFCCEGNKLTSLKGSPKKVKNFFCYDNQLITLEGAPTKINGDFECEFNKLTSLKGCPEEVEGHFNCSNNRLKSLSGAPSRVEGAFICHNNFIKFSEEEVRKHCTVSGDVN